MSSSLFFFKDIERNFLLRKKHQENVIILKVSPPLGEQY